MVKHNRLEYYPFKPICQEFTLRLTMHTLSSIISSSNALLLWITMGTCVAIEFRRRRTTHNLERSVFETGCIIFIAWQLTMTTTLFLEWYTTFSQWIIASAPWFIAVYSMPRKTLQKVPDYSLKWLIFTLLIISVYILYASPPPWMRDSMTYHLAMPKQYAIAGGFVQTDLVIFSFFPQGWHSILTLFHAPGTGEAICNPRWINVGITGLISLGITGFLRTKTNHQWAYLGGVLYLLTPSIFEFGTSCYVQPWLTALCLWLGIEIIERKRYGWMGLLIGCMCSLKYSALIVPLIITPYIVFVTKDRKQIALFIIGLLLIGMPFYLRNWELTGNPFFPLLYSIFAGNGWDEWRATAYQITLNNYGVGRSLIDYLLLPIRLFTTRELFGSFHGSLGITWIILLLHWRPLQRETIGVSITIIGWLLFWAFQVQQIRFMAPVLPLILLVTIPLMATTRYKTWILLLLLSAGWIAPMVQPLNHNQQTSTYLKSDIEEADAVFLRHRLPENYPVYEYLNNSESKKVWLIWMRGYHYYLNIPARIDNVFGAYRFEDALLNQTPQEFAQQLQDDGIDRIIINWRFFLVNDNADRLGEGVTNHLKTRFSELIHKNVLHPEQDFGPVWIYKVSDDSDSSESHSNSIE